MEPVTLHANGHELSCPRPSDVDRIFEVCQDPAIQRWTTVPVPYRREHAEGFVRDFAIPRWSDGTGCTWAVRDAGGAVIGMVGIDQIEGGSGTIGYWLAPEARGSGLMTAAVRAAISYAFDTLGLERIAWDAVVGNEASRRVALACGFRMEGQVRGYYYERGVRKDAWLGTLYASDPRPS